MNRIVHHAYRYAGIFAPLMAVFVLSGCSGSLDAKDYLRWVENAENGMVKETSLGGFDFRLQHKPLEYIALQEERTLKPTTGLIRKFRTERGGLYYFNFRIASKTGQPILETGKNSKKEYHRRNDYFTSEMQHDLFLVAGKDTISCTLYHFEHNHGLAPYNNMVVAFAKNSEETQDLQFVYADKVLGVGPVKITLKKSAFDHLPKLMTH